MVVTRNQYIQIDEIWRVRIGQFIGMLVKPKGNTFKELSMLMHLLDYIATCALLEDKKENIRVDATVGWVDGFMVKIWVVTRFFLQKLNFSLVATHGHFASCNTM